MTVEKAAPKYTKLRTLLAVSFALLGIASAGLATFATYQNARAQLRQDIREHLRDAVSLASLQVNGDNHATLTNPSQEGNYTYMQIKRELQRIRDTVRNAGTYIRFVYTMRQQPDGSIIFVVDAEESPEDISHLGDVYSDAGPVLTNNFSTMDHPIVEDDFYTDQWGTWLTGYAPFYTSNGKREGILGMDIPANNVIARERNALWTSVAIFGLMIPIMSLLGWLIGSSIAKPITTLTESIEQFTAGNLTHRVEVRTRTEVKKLANTFNTMAEQISSQVMQLEQRVAERTQALERRAVQLLLAADVGRAVASLRNLDELLTQTANLISQRFGFYHVGIFLLDEHKEYATLRASNSPGGTRMLEHGHKLKIGEVGIVGYVTAKGEGRIALDVGEDAVFFDNPDLPDTRSEMALPLIAGGQILGALDVQSTQEAAFSDEDIATLRVLADQIAVAIENARLFRESEATLEAARRAYGDLSRTGWERFLKEQPELGYISTIPNMITPTTGKWNRASLKALKTGQPVLDNDSVVLNLPVKIREQTIGVIRMQKTDGTGKWSEEETSTAEALSEQLSSALESARLYKDISKRADRERVVADITTRIRSTTDPEAMLQTALEELKNALGASQVQIVPHVLSRKTENLSKRPKKPTKKISKTSR